MKINNFYLILFFYLFGGFFLVLKYNKPYILSHKYASKCLELTGTDRFYHLLDKNVWVNPTKDSHLKIYIHLSNLKNDNIYINEKIIKDQIVLIKEFLWKNYSKEFLWQNYNVEIKNECIKEQKIILVEKVIIDNTKLYIIKFIYLIISFFLSIYFLKRLEKINFKDLFR